MKNTENPARAKVRGTKGLSPQSPGDRQSYADFGAVPDPSSLPATVCWSLVGFAGGMRAELERLSGRSPLWGLNAPEVLVEREGIYQDP